MTRGLWNMEKTKEAKERRARNAHRRTRIAAIRSLSPDERFQHDQHLLWHKLHTIFTRKEYVSYEDLPDKLKAQIADYGEFIYPL